MRRLTGSHNMVAGLGIVAATIAATMPATSSIAQEQGQRARSASETDTDKFLQRRSGKLQEVEGIVNRANGASVLQGLNATVRTIARRRLDSGFARSPEQRQALQNLYFRDVAQRLAVLGFRQSDLVPAGERSHRLILAAENAVSGIASTEDYVLLASDVVVARVTGERASENLGEATAQP